MVCRSSGLTTHCHHQGSSQEEMPEPHLLGLPLVSVGGAPSDVWSEWRCMGLAHQHWLSSAPILQDLGAGQYADHG